MKKTTSGSIHGFSLAGAITAAALPIGADSLALAAEECLLVIFIAAEHGEPISKKVALEAINTGAFGTCVGTAVFEALNIGYPFTVPAKITAAVSVMEALGHAVLVFYENGGHLKA